jgi:hypothetical protein
MRLNVNQWWLKSIFFVAAPRFVALRLCLLALLHDFAANFAVITGFCCKILRLHIVV